MIRADNVLTMITGRSFSVSTYNVAVLSSDPAEDIKDASDYIFGTATSIENRKYEIVISDIEHDIGNKINTKDFSSIKDIYDALFEGSVKAIIYDSAFESVFEDTNTDFSDDIRIIKTYTARIAVDVVAERTDVITKPFAIFISGADEWGAEISVDGRSDVNILCIVNPVTFQVLLISIPRDYYVPIPGISGDDKDKLTHAGLYGIDVQMKTIESLFDIRDIDYFVRINFNSLIFIIDDIGGIDIDNPYYFECTYADIAFEEGLIHLNGEEALWYARERKNLENGDVDRGIHQMMIIEAAVDKLSSFSSIAHFNELLSDIPYIAVTDMPDKSIRSLIQYQLQKNSTWDINKIQAKGEGMSQPSYAAGGQNLFVFMPYTESVDYIHGLITSMMNCKLIRVAAENEPDYKTLLYEPVYVDDYDYDADYDYDKEESED